VTVAELKRVHAEGRAAKVGAANPYRGRRVLAAVWRSGYRKMLDDMLAMSPARQAYLRHRNTEGPRPEGRAVARGGELSYERLGGGGIGYVVDGYRGAVGGQSTRGGGADATAAARYQGPLAC
jgi:hypothetical protein